VPPHALITVIVIIFILSRITIRVDPKHDTAGVSSFVVKALD